MGAYFAPRETTRDTQGARRREVETLIASRVASFVADDQATFATQKGAIGCRNLSVTHLSLGWKLIASMSALGHKQTWLAHHEYFSVPVAP
jgi:hypothetical protein